MKATGIIRRIDDLGRVVIPKEIRRTMNILWVDHWCRCCSCGQRWKYTERFTLDTAWIETEEED